MGDPHPPLYESSGFSKSMITVVHGFKGCTWYKKPCKDYLLTRLFVLLINIKLIQLFLQAISDKLSNPGTSQCAISIAWT
jgi:hypothetical protein